jgi:excisionase family DNA binding protein
MSDPAKNPFDLLVDQIRAAVREEIKAEIDASQQRKLLFTTAEAAERLNIDESWLAARARAGKIPHTMLGHYRRFSQANIDFIIASACVPVVHSDNDEQRIQTDAQGAKVKPGAAGEANERDGDSGGTLGERRAADIGAGGAGDETLARKKVAGGEHVGTQNGGGQLESTVQGPRATKAKNISKLPSRGELR